MRDHKTPFLISSTTKTKDYDGYGKAKMSYSKLASTDGLTRFDNRSDVEDGTYL